MKVKYFTKPLLVAAAVAGQKRGFNRQLDDKKLLKVLNPGYVYPVSLTLLHEHIAGKPVEPHIRAMIVVNPDGDRVMLDISMDMFDALPEFDSDEAEAADG